MAIFPPAADADDEMEGLQDEVSSAMIDVDGGRRLSRASIRFFQTETSSRRLSLASIGKGTGISTRDLVASLALDVCEHNLIGDDGKVRDEFILQRQSVNRPANLTKIPLLCDLTASSEITHVDGWVFTMLLLSGFAKMSSKIDELNTINVFPIADGDTGANMKVCLKLPTRNLLLYPSDNILIAVSNMAADVLLNGQGNSGTILSHFFVSLAEEVREVKKPSLTVDEFASCLTRAGNKMDAAVPNPVEGTLLSVCRDACCGLESRGPYLSLGSMLSAWNGIAQAELALTPERLVVDGVKILEKAGVVDSGAQGFVYLIEGMHLASEGLLPNLMDASMFSSATFLAKDESTTPIKVDHLVIDSKFRFCTECVVLLRDGIEAKSVVDDIVSLTKDGFGDSIASVKAPAKERGDMVKIHLHTNDPEVFFDRLRPYSKDPTFKKEKVEDMLVMRDLMHGDDNFYCLGDAKFTIMGMCKYSLPPLDDMDELYTVPVFLVPSSTQEPIDLRFVSDTDACIALNNQRHKDTAIRYTTAASNPMQLKIEILSALSKGKPLLIFLMSIDKRISAIGRNTCTAIEMLEPEEKARIKVFIHGWGFNEAPFLMEAIKSAQEGATIDEAYQACKTIADRNYSFSSFMTSATVKKMLAWRPGLFPEGFAVEDGSFIGFGIPVTVRDEILTEFQRVGMLMTLQHKKQSIAEVQDAEVERILTDLRPGERIRSVLIMAVGRPDFGYKYVEKMKRAKVPMTDDVTISVYNAGMFACATSNWGDMTVQYIVDRD